MPEEEAQPPGTPTRQSWDEQPRGILQFAKAFQHHVVTFDLHNSWPVAGNTAFHTSNTKLIRGWIIVLCATEKENIDN